MSVANDSAATGILGFLVKLYKPIILWVTAVFATKEEVAAIEQTIDLHDVTQQTAAAIWSGYIFATTDTDNAQSNGESEQSGESEQE